MRDRYQRASDHFCHTQLDLPTPITTNNISKTKNQSWSSSSSTNSSSFLDQTRNTRHSKSRNNIFLLSKKRFFSGLSNTSFTSTSS
jgi:hypothetical protein